jgi:hypothetical protein
MRTLTHKKWTKHTIVESYEILQKKKKRKKKKEKKNE